MKKTGIFKFIKPYLFQCIISMLLSVITVLLTLIIPIFTGEAIDLMLGQAGVDIDGVIRYVIIIAIIIPVNALLTYLMNMINSHICYGVSKDMRQTLFAHLMKLDISFFDRCGQGDVASRISNDADVVSDGLLLGISNLFTGIVTIICTLVFMLRVSWVIALVVIIITPVSLFVARFIARRTYDRFEKQAQNRAKQLGLASEAIENMDVIRQYGCEDIFIKKYDEVTKEYKNNSLAATFFSSITNPSTRFVNSIVYAAVGVCGAIYAVGGGITVGMLSVFLSYASQYTKPFNEISGVITELQNAFACAGRIGEVLDEPEEAEEKAEEEADNIKDNLEKTVEFEDVCFSYDKERRLIEHLDIKAKQGDRVAIVGPTGAGKSTLMNLLMRFYDVDAGSISVSGRDVRSISRDELRSGFGMVLQETFIRAGSVYDNIAFGREATKEEVIQAARSARAHSFIKRLPNGYETVLKENGAGLSEGEKQLICIARVMLRIPDMLILDEATSSIDTRTEVLIGESFKEMMKGRTSFVVAHRLQTIRDSDLILVMKDGQVVEQGTHDALISGDGYYKKLFSLTQS